MRARPRGPITHLATLLSLLLLTVGCTSSGGDSIVPPSTSPVLTTLRPELTTTTTEPRVQRQFYVVQQGDTLGFIADRFGVSVDAVMAENGMDSTVLTIGEQILIPPPTTAPADTTGTTDSADG